MIATLAAGVVGTCLGATVVRLWGPRAPVVPATLVRELVGAARADRDLAHQDMIDAQRVSGLLAVENMRLQGDVADLWAGHDADRATLADVRKELEGVEEDRHEQRERADAAEVREAAWELRAKHLAAALEQFVPRSVAAEGNVVLFPERTAVGFEGFR